MIIDASVAYKWIVPENDSDAAAALLGATLHAPHLVMSEVGNAIWKGVRRGELRPTDTLGEDIARLNRMVTLLDEQAVVPRALALAIQIDHPIYDCIYLAMAEAMNDVLITADAKFVKKVRLAQVAARVRFLSEAA